VKLHWIIYPLLEHAAKQLQKITLLFVLIFVSGHIKWILKNHKNVICIFGSDH